MAILTAAQVRARAKSDDIADPEQFTDDELDEYVAEFTATAERYCGRGFEPSQATETMAVCGSTVILSRRPVVSIDSLQVDGTAVAYTLDTEAKASGVINLGSSVSGDLTVTYTGGEVSPGILRACTLYVRAAALRDNSNAGRDVIAQGYDGGETRYSTPDWDAGRPTGYIEVDRILNGFGRALPGVA